ncbi:lysozyme [Pleurocapsales cyanobacterium LEGE 10410]|nr:lysozyme [Pleurocapsales cyanobacterium LEGE 10410]
MFSNSRISHIFYHSTIFLAAVVFSNIIVNDSSAASRSDLKIHQKLQSSSTNHNNQPNLELKKNIVASNVSVLPATINLVKEFEGFRSYAYTDTSGLPVVGYGQTRINGQTVRLGQYITQTQADIALRQELQHIQNLVKSHVQVDLNPHQLGALTSLVYNSGMRILTNSTLIRKLNAGDYAGAAKEFPRWNKANQGGQLVVFPGLTRRRLAEKQLFLTPYQQIASN